MSRTLLLFLFCIGGFFLAELAGCGSKDDAPASANISGSDRAKETGPKLDHLHPVVQLRTTEGDIVLQLDAEHAPVTVSNFLAYANSGQYNGTLFHDVQAGFVVLGGGYDSSLQEKPCDFPIRNEAHNGLKNMRGSVAMARRPDVIDSSTSMFFINVADNPMLDHKGEEPEEYGYCVFGKVIEGMDVVDKIAKIQVKPIDQFDHMPSQRVAIQSVRRVR